jgi:hypothetical protein
MRGNGSEHTAAVVVARGGPHDGVTLKTEHRVAAGSCNQHQYLNVTGGAADYLLKERWAASKQVAYVPGFQQERDLCCLVLGVQTSSIRVLVGCLGELDSAFSQDKLLLLCIPRDWTWFNQRDM